MNSISSLLNLGNSDYQASLQNRSREQEESLVAAREKIAQEQLKQQLITQQLQEVVDHKQASRRMYQMEQEIQKLSWAQAQMMIEVLTEKIGSSSAQQLEQVQTSDVRGILNPAYI